MPAKYHKLHLRNVLTTITDHFHIQHYVICLSAALSVRREFNVYNQFNITYVEIILRFFFWDSYFKFSATRYKSYAHHYTQLAWADTYKVGCAYMGYADLFGYHRNLHVCNYGPGGNYEDGSMYEIGAPCTRCPTSAPSCNDGLCVWGSYVEFEVVTGFSLVYWAATCLPSLAPDNTPLIPLTHMIYCGMYN
jgi:hypothetical protein